MNVMGASEEPLALHFRAHHLLDFDNTKIYLKFFRTPMQFAIPPPQNVTCAPSPWASKRDETRGGGLFLRRRETRRIRNGNAQTLWQPSALSPCRLFARWGRTSTHFTSNRKWIARGPIFGISFAYAEWNITNRD